MNVILVVKTVSETETVVAAPGSAVGVLVALGVIWSGQYVGAKVGMCWGGLTDVCEAWAVGWDGGC